MDAPTDAEVRMLAAAIARVAQELARSMPAPRGGPFFALDVPIMDPVALDAFSGTGIFRKYQRAVVLGSGMGGAARWWAARLGCRVVGVDPRANVSAAAAWLSERAALDGRTQFCTGALDALPVADRRFTHAWSIEGITLAAAPAVLRETFRVLRPAGHLAIELPATLLAGRDKIWWVGQAQDAGFVDVEFRDVPPAATPQFLLAALPRLRALLTAELPPDRAALLLELVRASRETGSQALAVQLQARHPS